jgi:hypothetical protein
VSKSDFAKLTESAGFDFIVASGVTGKRAVFTNGDRERMLSLCDEDERTLTAFLTPFLVQLCAEVGANFVNSEEVLWIPTLTNDPANFLKPNAFSSLLPVYDQAKEHTEVLLAFRRKLAAGRRFEDIYKFGGPIWDLRDLYVIWEMKWKISTADRGTAYNYLVNLSREDAYNTYTVILCDHEHFYIITGKNGNVAAIINKYAWTTTGSVQALHTALTHQNARARLLRGLCRQYDVTLLGFLGSGATGTCFSASKVVVGQASKLAMKAVLTCQRDSIRDCFNAEALAIGEFRKLEAFSLLPPTEALPVVEVVAGSFSRIYHDDVLVGVGYLMRDVGTPMVPLQDRKLNSESLKLLFGSLAKLHRAGHYHGDARIRNAIFVRGKQVIWIDLVWSSGEGLGENRNCKKVQDVVSLIESIFEGAPTKNDPVLQAMLVQYSMTLDNEEAIVAQLEGKPHRHRM